MTSRWVLLFIMLFLASCVRHSIIYDENGKQQHFAECRRGMVDCYRKAREVCPDGYRTIDRKEQVLGSEGGIYGDQNTVFGSFQPSVKRSLTFVCK